MTTPTALAPPVDRTVPPDLAGSAADGLAVIVAPCNGRFQPVVTDGPVTAGQVVARVAGTAQRLTDVHSPVTGRLRGLLTLPGHRVVGGQALAWALAEDRRPA